MNSLVLAGTDLKVSKVCMGTMTFGGQADEALSKAMFEKCLDMGINFFDTANSYTEGRSEEFTGRFLKGRRDKVILATKVRSKWGPESDQQGLKPAAMVKALDASLKRLQTDYLDLYYLHMPDWDTPLGDSLATLDGFVKAGKVRYPALSNYAAWQHLQALGIAKDKGYKAPLVHQPIYNLLARGLEQEYFAFCKEFKISSVVYNPLAGGLLSGKHAPDKGITPGTRFDKNKMYQDRYWHPAMFKAVEAYQAIAKAAGKTLVELSLQWVAGNPQVDAILLGASRMEQMEANLKALEGKLSPDILKACDEVWNELRGPTPKYNR